MLFELSLASSYLFSDGNNGNKLVTFGRPDKLLKLRILGTTKFRCQEQKLSYFSSQNAQCSEVHLSLLPALSQRDGLCRQQCTDGLKTENRQNYSQIHSHLCSTPRYPLKPSGKLCLKHF